MPRKFALLFLMALIIGSSVSASAIVIDNDIPSGTVGHWSVDVLSGGESRNADLTVNRQASEDVFTEDVLYDYFSYVDVGSGGFQLTSGTPSSSGEDQVSSSGSFMGSGNNTIHWSVVSSIADGDPICRSEFTFTAERCTLGSLRFFQYLDEDLEIVGDDVFFTRGSAAGGDLELFTIDNTEVYGVSHSGAFSEGQGLSNATFAGWAADEFDNMRPAIEDGTKSVSPSGVKNNLLPYGHPDVGASFGPADIVSVLAWDVLGEATSATIVTTLGGVPDVSDIPWSGEPVPEPATILLLGTGLAGIAGYGRRKRKKN